MPQMMPMNWILFLIMISIIFTSHMSYFKNHLKMKTLTNHKNTKSWKW